MGPNAGEWNMMAPVNVTEDGRIFRKTKFDATSLSPFEGEWMWVEVDSLDARDGILTNEPLWIPGLEPGAHVRFRVIPEGKPLSGCSIAVWWSREPVVDAEKLRRGRRRVPRLSE